MTERSKLAQVVIHSAGTSVQLYRQFGGRTLFDDRGQLWLLLGRGGVILYHVPPKDPSWIHPLRFPYVLLCPVCLITPERRKTHLKKALKIFSLH